MYTIKEKIENTEIIKNSKFITILLPVVNKDEVIKYLNEIKQEHPKATHYCYAYIIDEDKKSSDDGEPSGTAGYPILHVLEEKNLNHVLCVVVRYFGGIKLGAGGLVRAYTKSASNTINCAEIKELKQGILIRITFAYEDTKDIDYILKEDKITNKEYNELITYEVAVNTKTLNTLKEKQVQIEILNNKVYF